MTPKDYLQQVMDLDELIQSKITSVRNMRATVYSISIEMDEIKTSKTNKKVDFSDAADKIIDYENEINKEVDKLVDLKSKIVKEIDKIGNNLYKTILIKRYINGDNFSNMSHNLGYSIRHITRLHGEALQEFEKCNKQIFNKRCP